MSTTVFRSARVFDGTTFLPDDHDVLVTDGLIASVRPSGPELPAEAAVVDCAGRTLTPGFIDSHVHLVASNLNPLAAVIEPFSLPFYRAVRDAEIQLRAGVTSVREAGGADLGVKTAIDTGLIAGPRSALAIGILSQTGGHGDSHQVSGIDLKFMPETPGRPSGVADGVDQVRLTVRRMFQAGADQIKICTTGGVMSTRDNPRHAQFTPAEIRAAVEEAQAQDSYVMAHAIGLGGIKNALRNGVRSIEHGIYLDDEAIQLFLDHDAYLVPTLLAPRNVLRNAAAGLPIPQSSVDKAKVVVKSHVDSFARAAAAGVRIALGTDAGVGEHGEALLELALMAEHGLSLEAALAAGTSVAAELLPEGWPVGRIAAGHHADLVLFGERLTSADQLPKLPDLIDGVWKAGQPIRRD